MQHSNSHNDNETIWDVFDEYDLEQCIIKENEILTQNSSVIKEFDDKLLNNKTSNVGNKSYLQNTIKATVTSTNSKSNSSTKLFYEQKTSNSNRNLLLPCDSFLPIQKKQNFCKPFDSEPSSSEPREVDFLKKSISIEDKKSFQSQFNLILKEKAKLEEENLIKQGEVCYILSKYSEASLNEHNSFLNLEPSDFFYSN